MTRSNGVITSIKATVDESLMSESELQRMKQIVNRDTRVIGRYLGIIENNYQSIRHITNKGKITDRINASLLDQLTATTKDRAQVKHNLKRDFQRISLNELKECRDTAIGMYQSYLELLKKSQKKNAGKPRINGKLIPRTIGYRRFRLDCKRKIIQIMDSMDTNPLAMKNGKKQKHNWLAIPINLSNYHTEQFVKGEIKSIKIHRNGNYNIHFGIKHEVSQLPKKPQSSKPIRVVGIDLGINKSVSLAVLGGKGISLTKTFIQKEKKKSIEKLDKRIADLQRTKEVRGIHLLAKILQYRVSKLQEIDLVDTPLYHNLKLLSNKVSKFVRTSSIQVLNEIELLNADVTIQLRIAIKTLFDHMNHTENKTWKQINKLQKLQHSGYLISLLRKNTDTKTDGILKTLRMLSNQRNILSEEYDHQMTSCIVKCIEELKERYEVYVAVGRLRGIKNIAKKGNGNKAHRKRMHKWAFARVTEMLAYKLALIELKNRFAVVDERWTSKNCWKCNNKGQRPRQSYFICINPDCLWRSDADLNGAINIAKKLVKEFKLTNPSFWGVRGLGRYLPVASSFKPGARQSKNLPKAHSIGVRSPVHSLKGNGHAGADHIGQSSLIDWYDRNDPPVVKRHGKPTLMKSPDRGVGQKHVSVKKEVLVTRKRMATSNKNC
ncbi:MAG: zinc ribbon domain-containing protein [Candidatus Kariarchaeaceae archaeon]|jgi:IS605 OrfB family transposase